MAGEIIHVTEAEVLPEWQRILIEWLEADGPEPLDFHGNPIPPRLQLLLDYVYGPHAW